MCFYVRVRTRLTVRVCALVRAHVRVCAWVCVCAWARAHVKRVCARWALREEGPGLQLDRQRLASMAADGMWVAGMPITWAAQRPASVPLGTAEKKDGFRRYSR